VHALSRVVGERNDDSPGKKVGHAFNLTRVGQHDIRSRTFVDRLRAGRLHDPKTGDAQNGGVKVACPEILLD